jgi:hypothetical protein
MTYQVEFILVIIERLLNLLDIFVTATIKASDNFVVRCDFGAINGFDVKNFFHDQLIQFKSKFVSSWNKKLMDDGLWVMDLGRLFNL